MRVPISFFFIHLLFWLAVIAIPPIRKRKTMTVLPKQYTVNEDDTPCYICAAEWKFRQRSNAIEIEEEALLTEDDEKCCAATVIRNVEQTLDTMNPAHWESTGINGDLLKRDTDRLLHGAETTNMNLLEFRRQIAALEGRWSRYWVQQDFNKWTALRHWLRIPGIRKRIETVNKDIRGETSRRSRRLQERVRRAERLMEQTKSKLRDLYAIYHREGKSRFSECNLKRRITIAVQKKNAQLRPRFFHSAKPFPQLMKQTRRTTFHRWQNY